MIIEHRPSEGGRAVQLNSTLTLSRELIPLLLPEDNFTLLGYGNWLEYLSLRHPKIMLPRTRLLLSIEVI